jgi:hypothetical protein
MRDSGIFACIAQRGVEVSRIAFGYFGGAIFAGPMLYAYFSLMVLLWQLFEEEFFPWLFLPSVLQRGVLEDFSPSACRSPTNCLVQLDEINTHFNPVLRTLMADSIRSIESVYHKVMWFTLHLAICRFESSS